MLTADRAAAHLGVATRTVYHATLYRGLPVHRVGRALLFAPGELDAWRAEHPARHRSLTGVSTPA